MTPLAWVAFAAAGWALLSIPAALLTGRFIATVTQTAARPTRLAEGESVERSATPTT